MKTKAGKEKQILKEKQRRQKKKKRNGAAMMDYNGVGAPATAADKHAASVAVLGCSLQFPRL